MNKITVKDALYKRAKKLVLDDNNASISYVQRKLEISYNRARIIVELLEKKDAISTPDKYGIRRIMEQQE